MMGERAIFTAIVALVALVGGYTLIHALTNYALHIPLPF